MSRRKLEPDAKIALPITPMLDMTFQLLFFFIMNFNPADLEGQIDAALPSQQEPAHNQLIGCVPAGNIPPAIPSDLTVEVRTRQAERENGISGIFVLEMTGHRVSIDGLDGLAKYLTDARANAPREDTIKIRADARLRLQHVLKVLDVCKAAGYTKTTLIPPEELGR